jgi:hypothetical protein
MYQRPMSPLDNLSKMSLFFVTIHIKVVEDMVHEGRYPEFLNT